MYFVLGISFAPLFKDLECVVLDKAGFEVFEGSVLPLIELEKSSSKVYFPTLSAVCSTGTRHLYTFGVVFFGVILQHPVYIFVYVSWLSNFVFCGVL